MALTRYRTGITILTEDLANSWYGGLFGTTEGNLLDPDDPLVAGHVHDGSRNDGHAQKINLSSHVTGLLPKSFIEGGDSVGLIVLTEDGRIVQDSSGNILLKENQ